MGDNMDFKDTDIPEPHNLELPETAHISGQELEEIRDKVLAWSMDHSVQQQMDLRQCDVCRSEIYSATLICPKCAQRDGVDMHAAGANVQRSEMCVVTGYPVLKRTRVDCSNCCAAANRDDWNAWLQIFKVCPWCAAAQNTK